VKHFIRLTDYTAKDIYDIFRIADEVQERSLDAARPNAARPNTDLRNIADTVCHMQKRGRYTDILKGKSIVLFFPNTSIRTRVTFEKGIDLLGGQPILFPTETLDKKEDLRDVVGYLKNWADMVIVRHRDIGVLERLSEYSDIPVINAMTDSNHPCEIVSDLYALSRIRKNFVKDRYLFCGKKGNIGLAWKEASEVMGFELTQCCPKGYEMEGVSACDNIAEAVRGKDIICTDSLPTSALEDFKACQVTEEIMRTANKGAILNPCPPFFRGEEVSADVIDSEFFVGYAFKKFLLEIQQAVMIYCLTG